MKTDPLFQAFVNRDPIEVFNQQWGWVPLGREAVESLRAAVLAVLAGRDAKMIHHLVYCRIAK